MAGWGWLWAWGGNMLSSRGVETSLCTIMVPLNLKLNLVTKKWNQLGKRTIVETYILSTTLCLQSYMPNLFQISSQGTSKNPSDTDSTTFPSSTFPLKASLANVAVLFPGTHLCHPCAGEAVGSLIKFAQMVWIVLESVFSSLVAVVALKVPKISRTTYKGVSSLLCW